MIQECLIRRKIAKTKGFFFKKNKLVSKDSELSNSARNGKKKIWRQTAVFGGNGGTAAVSSVFRVDQFNSENILKN